MSLPPRQPPGEPRSRLARLRSTLPRNRRESLAAALAFAPPLGAAIIMETAFGFFLPLVPTGLTIGVALFLLSTRWLRRRERPPKPREPAEPLRLPPPVRPLIGREAEVEEVIDQALKRGLVIVRGVAGIGTSALAVNAGWRLAPETHRQRYADLRGQDPDEPEGTLSVVERVLRTLDCPLGPIESLEGAARKVSAALQHTDQVLLLDNVERWSQVAWLPRHVPGSWMIVAGELKAGAGDAVPADVAVVQIGLLDADDGVALLSSQIAKERIEADPAATERLTNLFLRRPAIAVGIGRWLAENPQVPIATLVTDLEQGPHDHTLHVLLAMQLRRVSPGAQRLLALFARAPIAELGIDGATALAGGSEPEVEQAMEELSQHGLVEKVRTSRVRVVDAARAIAAPPKDWDAAWQRLVERFADRADFFAERLHEEEARHWFGIEDRALLQILRTRQPSPRAAGPLGRIADALEVWFLLEQRHQERREAARALTYAARTLGDADVQATAELRLCLIALALGDPRAAQEHLDNASGLQAGVESWPVQLHLARAATLLATGDEFTAVESSLVQYGQALPGGDAVGQATRWINMAVLRIRRGQVCGFEGRTDEANRLYADALGTLVQALGISEQAGDVHAQAHSRELLALVHWYLGRAHDATRSWEKAVQLYERSGDTIGQARCQVHQAAALPRNRREEAGRLLRSALTRLPTTGVSTALAWLHLAGAEPRNAQRHREKGLDALAPWDGIAEPLQVTEIRRRLRSLPSADPPGSGTLHDPA
ncbi:hypothetical protein SAMN05216276_106718 [Streptosporangium subroseum]|uniref:Tetratricopeptide repeat-containing protein n=1 Tax=Streptosporangium subroseum TaxID=106412 RepID=A0A239NTB3_9ACTN|nr:hypothetical protein [Streptosporangium subroseum]SNT57584.1 hypothetical protein SAMN05216276_106718 [Streptosporangium subroseum]